MIRGTVKVSLFFFCEKFKIQKSAFNVKATSASKSKVWTSKTFKIFLVNPSNYSDGCDKLISHVRAVNGISGHFDPWDTSIKKILNRNLMKSSCNERKFLLGVTNRIWILLWAHVWWWRKIFYVYSIYVMYNYIYMFSRWLATIRLHQKVKK